MRTFVPRITLLVFGLAVAAALAPQVRAQTTTSPNCTASSDAAVQRFVGNAVTTDLNQPR
ncbi:MAG: hypothetical protein ABSC10_11390 [Candidatus Acidiferrales bacterium]|jgi:hypothetical protein